MSITAIHFRLALTKPLSYSAALQLARDLGQYNGSLSNFTIEASVFETSTGGLIAAPEPREDSL